MAGAGRKPYREVVGGSNDDDDDATCRRATEFAAELRRRRSVRQFSGRAVPRAALEQIVWAAASAPSGANQQPWHFAVVTGAATKHSIRVAAEHEEREFYQHRAPEEWRRALEPLGTDADKAFLEDAAALIVVFMERWGTDDDGGRSKRYYPKESVGIATGLLVTAAHVSGLVALTYTPSPMGFLGRMLGRPDREVPFMIVAVGHPADDATVPDIDKKPLEEVASFFEDDDDTRAP